MAEGGQEFKFSNASPAEAPPVLPIVSPTAEVLRVAEAPSMSASSRALRKAEQIVRKQRFAVVDVMSQKEVGPLGPYAPAEKGQEHIVGKFPNKTEARKAAALLNANRQRGGYEGNDFQVRTIRDPLNLN